MAKDEIAKFLADRLRNNNRLIRQHVSPEDLERSLSGGVNSWFDIKAEEQKRQAESRNKEETIRHRKFYQEQFALMAAVMTGLWRLRQKLANPTGDGAQDANEFPDNYAGQLWETLRAAGYRAEEIPERLVDSPDVRIVAYEFHPDLGVDRVAEMVRPVLYYKNMCIQTGQVIIATATQKEPHL